MNIFSFENNRTPEQKEKDNELYYLIEQYEKKLNDQLSTETISLSNEEFILALQKCLDEGITINDIYPGINDYEEDCDY